MKYVKKIVVPIDFLKNTDRLVDYAAFIAEKLSADIQFIHVVELFRFSSLLENPHAADLEESLLVKSEMKMSKIVDEIIMRNPGCDGEVLSGDPVEEIVEFAKMQDADMIIIATHGAKGLERIMMGSVTKRVLKRAHCPVLVINPFKG